MTVSSAPAADGEPGTLQVNLRIEAGSLRFQQDGPDLSARIQVIFAGRTPDGSTRLTTDSATVKIAPERWEAVQREGLRYARRWKPAPDAMSLRVVVRDTITGQYGTLDVPLNKLGPAQN
jgi:hypothetical protein